jgi:protein phosphatase
LADLDSLPGDVLLLVTDGLTRHVDNAQMVSIVLHADTLDAACDALIEAARQDGGSDNITCVLVHLLEQPWYRKLIPGSKHTLEDSA